jgi:hypothetical protein
LRPAACSLTPEAFSALAAIALLAGCHDPALDRFTNSLAAWDEGKTALAAGDPAKAAEAFGKARASDDQSRTLGLWEAKALADAGKLDEADARLSELIKAAPDDGVAFYNRAAYRVRAKRLAEAAIDLREALRLGVRSPFEATADPDFAGVRLDEAFAGILPQNTLVAVATGPSGSVFVGSRVEVTLRIAALPGLDIHVRRDGPDPGCLALVRVVQDDHAETGVASSTLTLAFDAKGPCDGQIGPLTVFGGLEPLVVAPVPVVVEAPAGAATAPVRPLPDAIPLPATLAPSDGGMRADRSEAGVIAMGRADRSLTGNGAKPDVALEWRVDGQTRATGGWWFETGPVTVSTKGWEKRL